ncbi:Aldo/keto reductase [Lactarius indigo]|nr:Aldo/keto reductase [Lactarius indigo]
MPLIGLGTWKSSPGQVELAVEIALKNGYRHVDTATAYKNEKEVGIGLKASGVPRKEIFLTTKLDNIDHKDVPGALDNSLKLLGTDYVDLYLMHWPAPMTADWKADKSLSWLDTWKEMEKVYLAHPEKVKAIGVSNVSVAFLGDLLKVATVVPAVNQVERHPSCLQDDVLDACTKAGIVVTSYSPLGSDHSPLLENDIVLRIARSTISAQPTYWSRSNYLCKRRNPSVCSKKFCQSLSHASVIITNLKVVDLAEEEIAELKTIEKTSHFRACPPGWTGWGNLGFPDC